MAITNTSWPSRQTSGFAPPYPELLQQLRIRKLIVFRALQLGDMLCAVPALRALRKALPDTRITLAGLPWAAQFAHRFQRYVDDFIAFPGHPAFPEQAVQQQNIPAFYNEVRARAYDLALQMHGSGEVSNRVVRDFQASAVAGFAGRCGVPDKRAFLAYPRTGAEPLRLLQLVEHLGAPIESATLEFPISSNDRNELRTAALADHRAAGSYFCVHPGARNRAKCWPLNCFANVADAIAEEFGLQPVLTGSPAETDLTAALAARMRSAVVDSAGPLSIGAMAALMQGARLVLCNDTGVSHIAAALRLPSVVIFSNADMQRWRPLNSQLHRCIRDPAGVWPQLALRHARQLLRRQSLSVVAP